MAQDLKLTKNQSLVFDKLSAAPGPLSAYDLLDQLRDQGLKAPLQIYRALEKLQEVEKKITEALYQIPNIPHSSVRAGRGEDENEVIKEHGTAPNLAQNASPHWDLIKQHDIIDFELGNKISAAGFPVYKGNGARIQRALINAR